MTKIQARFFAKWLVRLRPKLSRLKSSAMNNITGLVKSSSVIDKLQQWKKLPLDSDEFINFLCE
jgi:hypothetical protein